MSKPYRIEVLRGPTSGSWYWRLSHRNGKILSHSEIYNSKQAACKTARHMSKLLNAEVDLEIRK